MNKVLRTFAVALAAPAIAGVALAGTTAAADPPLLNGTYGSTDGDPYNVWTIATSCGAAGCSGTVASNQGWTSSHHAVRWPLKFTVSKPGGLTCDDGDANPPWCRCRSTRRR